MGQTTGISWCDATFNPWIGCSKISPGCEHCYAETQNNLHKWNPAGWGPGAPRKRTSPNNWAQPIKWARQAVKDGVIRRVFCASLADVFDSEVDPDWRIDLFSLIEACSLIGGLEWLLLTKRPGNIKGYLPVRWLISPPVFLRIGVTAEDQENADVRIPELLTIWMGKNFISYEPALGSLDLMKFTQWEGGFGPCFDYRGTYEFYQVLGYPNFPVRIIPGIDWVICGGESGPGCRPMDLSWARSVRDQCASTNVPFFFKQIGGHPDKRGDLTQWPEDLRIQQFPE